MRFKNYNKYLENLKRNCFGLVKYSILHCFICRPQIPLCQWMLGSNIIGQQYVWFAGNVYLFRGRAYMKGIHPCI
jgi:hypothetical protein